MVEELWMKAFHMELFCVIRVEGDVVVVLVEWAIFDDACIGTLIELIIDGVKGITEGGWERRLKLGWAWSGVGGGMRDRFGHDDSDDLADILLGIVCDDNLLFVLVLDIWEGGDGFRLEGIVG